MSVLFLAYDRCDTCKKAKRWLDDHDITVTERPIVDEPPTKAELAAWIEASGLAVRKWLNTSGQSYRAIGKDKVDAAKDGEIVGWLAKDGKLVKRPVLVCAGKKGKAPTVLVGFRAEAYEEVFES
jgi:arsenate reductase